MAREVKVAAAQLGPINEGTSRDEVVERMLGLLERAIAEQVELIAYPEMALTTYFPKEIRDDDEQFFETDVRWDFYSRRHPELYRAITEPVRARA
jgi:predicted amidohydrolase